MDGVRIIDIDNQRFSIEVVDYYIECNECPWVYSSRGCAKTLDEVYGKERRLCAFDNNYLVKRIGGINIIEF